MSLVPRGAALIVLLLAAVAVAADRPPQRDQFFYLLETNRAQLVMLVEQGLLPRNDAARIARALDQAAREQEAPGAARSSNWLDLETRLIKLSGPDASNLHLGRSRNDLTAAMHRMELRERTLTLVDRIGAVRMRLQKMAGEHHVTVIPGFTHAVQAQPTTLAHFLLAFDSSLARDSERLREAYARLNRSPLGVGAFTTSSVELDRRLLADLLGFEGLIENGYDAIMVAEGDSKVELAQALALSALNIGRFTQYILFQYDSPAPGTVLNDAAASRSSSMPQKRNPSSIERLRLAASEVVAGGQLSTLLVHNTPLYEVKEVREDHFARLEKTLTQAELLYKQLATTLDSLTIRREVLREQVDRDYSTMTELAETLFREAGTPFRIGHRVSSELTTYGRDRGKRPLDLTRDEVAAVYERVAEKPFPLTAEQLRRALDPLEVVRSRKGIGGPQPAETERLLGAAQQNRDANQAWTAARREQIASGAKELARRFQRLAEGVPSAP